MSAEYEYVDHYIIQTENADFSFRTCEYDTLNRHLHIDRLRQHLNKRMKRRKKMLAKSFIRSNFSLYYFVRMIFRCFGLAEERKTQRYRFQRYLTA